jgi:hypothetical protein
MPRIWKMLIGMASICLLMNEDLLSREVLNRQALKETKNHRLAQNRLLDSFRELRQRMEVQSQTSAQGASYVSIIPYVAADANTRTNLGLNNFSQNSLIKGPNPTANVLVGLFDPQGNLIGTGSYQVRTNELLQVNGIFSSLGGTSGVGWLLIFSDEPLTAWASVINNANNDPSIELAVADQIFKPAAFVESTGTRLMIQSSTKLGAFQSSLAVVNVGTGDGNLSIKIYDNSGSLINTVPSFIRADGMYVNNDVRSGVSGTFGQIVIEVADTNPNDDQVPRLAATSLVRSLDGTSAFFPALALPQANTNSIAGRWEGTLSAGTLINAQVRIDLFQERDMIYGTFDILSGVFPTTDRNFSISGEIIDNNHVFQLQDIVDGDASQTLFTYRFLGALSGNRLRGDTIYFDERKRSAVGTFDLGRTGSIY